jgi:hypothetical protein
LEFRKQAAFTRPLFEFRKQAAFYPAAIGVQLLSSGNRLPFTKLAFGVQETNCLYLEAIRVQETDCLLPGNYWS